MACAAGFQDFIYFPKVMRPAVKRRQQHEVEAEWLLERAWARRALGMPFLKVSRALGADLAP